MDPRGKLRTGRREGDNIKNVERWFFCSSACK